ncbi:MAG: SMP-30/gluconolactonase/LRE family protein [Anaerolineaceae bacterium]
MHKITTLKEPLLRVGNILGECPLWHPVEKRLYWVDIEKDMLFRLNPLDHALEKFNLGVKTGCFGFRGNGGLILATELGFAFWSEENSRPIKIMDLYEPNSGIMMNDGRVDLQGRLWAGSKGQPAKAGLFLLNPQLSHRQVLDGVTIANGIDWSLDARTCYFTDSGTHTIFRYRFNPEDGNLSDPEIFFSLAGSLYWGTPDGLCVDSGGNVWSAIWDGGKILQLSPDGEIQQELLLPVTRPTSIAFGGEDLKDLYITSASTELTPQELSTQPFAGDLFVFHTEIPGRQSHFFPG